MAIKFSLPLWYDLHTHVRQDGLLEPVIKSLKNMGCAGFLAMPNTKPPVAKIRRADDLPYWSIEEYRAMIMDAGGNDFTSIITPLYLTKDTTPAMIEDGARSGLLRACKYYPPHGTTGADFGVPLEELMKTDIFAAMVDHGVTLCIHGEEHGLGGEDYFGEGGNAEDFFYRTRVPQLLDQYPGLRLVCEHITTRTAAAFVDQAGDNVAATITPQHLLYTIGDLLQGCKYHLYCLPLLKFATDRDALRRAVTNDNNKKFFAGTDSAPHTVKATACGCAAGCFTGDIAPQLYAEGFEQAGVDLSNAQGQEIFKRFLCDNGRAYYDLPVPDRTFTLQKTPQTLSATQTPEGTLTPLPLGLGHDTLPWSMTF